PVPNGGLDYADDFLVQEPLLAISQRGELAIDHVQFFFRQGETKLFAAMFQRMPAAVFSQHQLAFRHSNGLGVDDFVGRFLLEISVLMDAGFMREGVAAYDGLVWLRPKSDDRAQELAG